MADSDAQPLIQRDDRDGVAVITLADGGRRNALTAAMVTEFIGVLDAAEADPRIGAVLITGEGPAFCAGADLRHLVGMASGTDRAEESLRSIYAAFMRLYQCALPTLAAVNGPAVGAGMNLALACDLRIVGYSAKFSTRFLSLGLHPGGGHTWMLRNAVGASATAAAVLFGEDLSGAEAERIGLAWRAVPDEQLMDTAIGLAARAASMPRDVGAETKRTIREVAEVPRYEDAVELELARQLWSARQEEFPRRMAALTARTRTSGA
jgi:enoyl-CoA hydratase